MPDSPVISYLRYLQEVSRKILLRSGFENVLYKKSKRQNPCHLALNESDRLDDYLLRLRTYLQRDTSKGLYVGLGLFVGTLDVKLRRRYIAAPLFICAVDLESEDDSNAVSQEIRWNSITLNYDFLTMILEQQIDREDEETGLPQIDNLVAPEKLKMLSDIEDEFEREIDDERYQRQLLNGEKLRLFVNSLKQHIPEFSVVKVANDEFDFDDLNVLVEGTHNGPFGEERQYRISFFNHKFFFVAPVPEQLATYIALRELVRQIKD